ncbi:MAG: PIN domain-containing protein [Halobacteriaceae archaeon]
MTTVVVDSTVLIYLARLGDLDLLGSLFDRVIVPEPVYDEVVKTGHEEDYRDAIAVEEAMNEFMEIVELSDDVARQTGQIQDTADLGRGEAAAMALARHHDGQCLTDDHAARTTAESVGLEIGGTIFVLLEALTEGQLSFKAYESRIDQLANGGFRMSALLYRRALEAGKEISEE